MDGQGAVTAAAGSTCRRPRVQASAGLQMQSLTEGVTGEGGGAGVTVRLGFMGFEGFRACIKARRFKLRCLGQACCNKTRRQPGMLHSVYTRSSEP